MVKSLKNRKWRVLSSEYLLREGAWCTVRRDSVELPNGKVIPNWYVYEFPNWANVVAVDRKSFARGSESLYAFHFGTLRDGKNAETHHRKGKGGRQREVRIPLLPSPPWLYR